MSVKEVKTSMPSSVEHGGVHGVVLPVGNIAGREGQPKQGTLRGNISSSELELFIGNKWISYEPKTSVEATVSDSFTAKASAVYPVDTSEAPITVTLPFTTKIGSKVTLIDAVGSWDTRNVTVVSQNAFIDGGEDGVVLTTKYGTVTFTYLGNSKWISDLKPSGLPSNDITDSDWPLATRANESYFINLNSDNDNSVTLPDAKNGDTVRLVSLNVRFSDLPILIKTLGNASVEDQNEFLLDLDTKEVIFEYLNTGWVIANDGKDFMPLHYTVIESGSLNSLVKEGKHKFKGIVSDFTMLPLSLTTESNLDGHLEVTITDSLCTQELTVVTGLSQINTRRFLRTGRLTESSVTFSSAWVELLTVSDSSRRVLTNPDDLVKDLKDGFYYIVDPASGTPDHEVGDVYLVEVLSSGSARPNSQANYPTRSIKAWNVNKNQWWETHSASIVSSSLWRKVNANHVIKVNDGDTVNYQPLASVTNIWVDGEGNQTINLNCESLVSNLESAKIGDVVVIHNLRQRVKQTVVNSSIDIVDSEGDNIGKGPHSMTGKGALKLLLESDADGTVYFKQLFGVRS